jgi:diamine N-acetyltransferase
VQHFELSGLKPHTFMRFTTLISGKQDDKASTQRNINNKYINNTVVLIKKAQPDDAPTIARLGRTTFEETFQHVFPIRQELDEYLEATFSVAKIASSMQKPNNVFWLAFANDVPVGYAKLKLTSWYGDVPDEGMSQLQKIYVLHDFLDQKVGAKLLQGVEQEWLTHQKQVLWLAVLNSNERAIRFYEKTGFQFIKKHTHQIGSQLFKFKLMAKTNSGHD